MLAKILKGNKKVIAVSMLLLMSTAHAQFAGITAGVAANQVMSQLDGLIGSAQDAGDYLAVRAAMEAKGVIETWKEANKDLLDKAFSELDNQQQQVFNNARQLAAQANADVDNRLKHTEAIVTQANQLISTLPLNKDTYVLQFTPRVIPSQAASTFTVRVKGVNLDAAEPVMTVADTKADRMIIGPTEVHYTLPLSQFPRDANKLAVVPLTLTYNRLKDGFWNRLVGSREVVERQIPVVALPTNIGSYNYVAVVETEEKQTQQFTSQPQLFEGRNTNKQDVAKPPQDWQWDLAQGVGAFSQSGHGGHAGSCNGILINESTKDGITHRAHLDEQRRVRMTWRGPRVTYGAGRQNCAVTGPIFKMVKVQKTIPVTTGVVAWTEDLRLPIPAGLKSHSLEVTTFDGRKRVFTGTGNDKFFDVLQSTSQLVIQPRQPTDI